MWLAGLTAVIGAGFFMASVISWLGWLGTHFDEDPLPIWVPLTNSVLFVAATTVSSVLNAWFQARPSS